MTAKEVHGKERSIRSYVVKCFKDAFNAEERPYGENLWAFEYVCVKNSFGTWQLIPLVFWCTYERVRAKVAKRLKNNLMKNFGIHYGRSDDMRYLTYDDSKHYLNYYATIDANWTEAMFQVEVRGKLKYISLSLFEGYYDDMPKGECMVAQRFERLLFTYYGMDADTYRSLDKDDTRRNLPDELHHDWIRYWDLYYKTFGNYPGSNYEFVCSAGVKRIIGKEISDDRSIQES